jgi:tRNA1(Val) A37 N6-methylase TrmN6
MATFENVPASRTDDKRNLNFNPPEIATKCARVSAFLNDPYTDNDVTLDVLTGSWRVFQLKRGHRFSVDDLFTAWRACNALPVAETLLDLGSGIGSVGLSTLAKMRNPHATLLGIEAQRVSFQLATASILENNLSERVTFLNGDFRTIDEILGAHFSTRGISEVPLFDLITGSPPYLPSEKSRNSPDSQKAHCRVELRGRFVLAKPMNSLTASV